MNLEEIMQPYLDKQKEINDKYIIEKNFLQMRIERLKNNKEKEINQYIENAILENPNFYNGYGAMIRKDLEQEYANKEKTLELQLKNIDKFYRLDIRELVDIKWNLRKDLLNFKNKLELELKEQELEFENVNLKFARFKHEYDENHIPTNGEEYKKLFDRSHELVEIKYNIQKKLTEVQECFNSIELTQEEINIISMTLTPWEQEEYDRRKNINQDEKINKIEENNLKVEESVVLEKEQEQELEKETVLETKNQEETVEPELIEPQEPIFENENALQQINVEYNGDEIVADSFKTLLETIYVDIIDSAKKIRVIKKDNNNTKFVTMGSTDETTKLDAEIAELPNGTYLNKEDLSKALDNYRKQNKGTTFKVKGINTALEITKGTVKKVKQMLNECTIHTLMSEKKLGFFDIKRVYGKEKAEHYSSEIKNSNAYAGKYIELNEFGNTLGNLFAEKSQSWLKIFKEYNSKLHEKLDSEILEETEEKQNVKTK